ncbi:SpoIIE family protein phosphatase [Streptomyces sp. NPDC052036]|uniref:SpoIIE family protein phosphatase n=1 Tax=Streptomyces sp. NPDC052036 TaxID=3155171 RepID=UPI003431CD6F
MGGKAKRPGRPWSPPRGGCIEINQLAELMRGWLDEALVSVPQLHRLLTPDHFADQAVPNLRQLRDRLAGQGLEWDLVEAVADVCYPAEPVHRATNSRLQTARELWHRAQTAPTPLGAADALAVTEELLAAKDRVIAIYAELERVRRALEASERGRHQALQVGLLLFAMLGQAQAASAELRRSMDSPAPESAAYRALQVRYARVHGQELELRQQLARAERDRAVAQEVADHGARRIRQLEAELAVVRARQGQGDQVLPRELPTEISPPELTVPQLNDAALDDVDLALAKARLVLDEEHEAVQQAADDLRYRPDLTQVAFDSAGPAVRIVPGQIHRPGDVVGREAGRGFMELSGTTVNNPLADSHSIGVGAVLPGVHLASRHVHAGASGGWCCAVPLPDTRIVLAAGDLGHPLGAGALRQLLSSLRSLAFLKHEPGEVVLHFSDIARDLGAAHTATCLYTVYDPVEHLLSIASTGHVSPLLLQPDGSGQVIDVSDWFAFDEMAMRVPAGATLMLYTRGLVESQHADMDAGIEQLRERLTAAGQVADVHSPPSLQRLCDALLVPADTGPCNRDIALIGARLDGIEAGNVIAKFVKAWDPQCAATAAARLRDALNSWGLTELTTSVELLVRTVVGQLSRHASNMVIALRLLRLDGLLRCEIALRTELSGVGRPPRLAQVMGLFDHSAIATLDSHAHRWGDIGEVIWFEKPLSIRA